MFLADLVNIIASKKPNFNQELDRWAEEDPLPNPNDVVVLPKDFSWTAGY